MSLLIEIGIYISVISIATERLVELFKLVIPEKQWNNQTLWQFFVGLIASFIGGFIAWVIAPEAALTSELKHIAFTLIVGMSSGLGSKFVREVISKSLLNK